MTKNKSSSNNNNNNKIKVKKCPKCTFCSKPEDLPAHIKFQHETPNAGLMTELDKTGRAKLYFCVGCTPDRKSFISQSALDQHKSSKNH